LCVHRIRVVDPALDCDLLFLNIRVVNLEKAIAGKRSYKVMMSFLVSVPAFPSTVSCSPFSKNILGALVLLRSHEKSSQAPVRGGHKLGGNKRPDHRFLVVKTSDHTGAQVVIKFNAQVTALYLKLAWGCGV
jgi:hypothetical protein